MSHQLILPDIGNAISLPGSESGPSPCGEPDGRTIRPCGRDPALASLSARQAKAQACVAYAVGHVATLTVQLLIEDGTLEVPNA